MSRKEMNERIIAYFERMGLIPLADRPDKQEAIPLDDLKEIQPDSQSHSG